jgi:hypothetical protein
MYCILVAVEALVFTVLSSERSFGIEDDEAVDGEGDTDDDLLVDCRCLVCWPRLLLTFRRICANRCFRSLRNSGCWNSHAYHPGAKKRRKGVRVH